MDHSRWHHMGSHMSYGVGISQLHKMDPNSVSKKSLTILQVHAQRDVGQGVLDLSSGDPCIDKNK